MFGADDRGQAIQIGAIILFSFVVIGFSLYQATVVPDQNAQVEFNHNQEVQQDMLELRGGVLSAGSSGSGTTTTVQLGTQYPARIFAVNPGPPSGSLRTVDPGGGSTVTIANAEAGNDETADFWSGTGSPREYTTRGLHYQPNYNEYRQAPETVYENTVVYNRGPNGGVSVRTSQQLVSGRELDLTVLLGSYQASQSESTSIDISSPANEPRTVAVQPRGDPINVTVPTGLSEPVWTELLEPEFVANGGYVDGSSVTVRGGILSFEFRETDGAGDPITYELRVPAAGVGTGVVDPTAAYVTDVSGNGTSIPEGGTQQVVAEVRNEFNGPESGVSTCAGSSIPGSNSGSLRSTTATTGEDGRVSFVYVAPDDVDQTRTATVTVGFGADGCDGSGNPEPSAPAEAVAEFEVDVLNTDGSGGGSQPENYFELDDGSTNEPPKAVDVSGSEQNTYSGAKFTLVNTRTAPVSEITDISVDILSTPNSAPTKIREQDTGNNNAAYRDVVFVDARNTGYVDRNGINIGQSYSFDQTTGVDGGDSTAIFYLNEFQRSNSPVEMRGAEIEVTVTYVDGNGNTITQTFQILLDDSLDNN